MLDILANFDALGLGALIGSLLFLGALLWVLLDNRSFDELNRRTMSGPADPVAATGPSAKSDAGSVPLRPAVTPAAKPDHAPVPGRPTRRPRRAA